MHGVEHIKIHFRCLPIMFMIMPYILLFPARLSMVGMLPSAFDRDHFDMHSTQLLSKISSNMQD